MFVDTPGMEASRAAQSGSPIANAGGSASRFFVTSRALLYDEEEDLR